MAFARATLLKAPLRRRVELAQPLAAVAGSRSFGGQPDLFKRIGKKYWEFTEKSKQSPWYWKFTKAAYKEHQKVAAEYWNEWDDYHHKRREKLVADKIIDLEGKVIGDPKKLTRDDAWYLAPGEVAKYGFVMEDPEDGFLTGPFGTVENPVIVPSNENNRIVGCVGGRNGKEEHPLLWFTVRRGPKHRCPCCGQVFQLKTSWREGMPVVPHPTDLGTLPPDAFPSRDAETTPEERELAFVESPEEYEKLYKKLYGQEAWDRKVIRDTEDALLTEAARKRNPNQE